MVVFFYRTIFSGAPTLSSRGLIKELSIIRMLSDEAGATMGALLRARFGSHIRDGPGPFLEPTI